MISNDNSLFYCNIEDTRIDSIKNKLMDYSEKNSKQVYVIEKALGTKNEYEYDISDVALVLIPKHAIAVVSYGDCDNESLKAYLEDLKEDIGHIADKYEYSKILGRVRKWSDELFSTYNLNEFSVDEFISLEASNENVRKIDLIISLLIGSINDIDKIGINEPETLLDKVKRKIILFDGQQSRFIYGQPTRKRITIQGLAGTGKTELLMNKLKEVYVNFEDSKIAFTCYNKVLASELKNRKIPQFFNFMKVSEQIEWDNRLSVFSSWGSGGNPFSGMISYICYKYNTTFKTYKECRNFELLCKDVMAELEVKELFEPCFDYIFIDESQDFGEEFFKLCEKITRKNVYIAGDIFQNIFDTHSTSSSESIDYLLNKCYRTDPKTLMFAHAVGMGLYESPKINWLDEEDWIKCGYTFEKNNGYIKLSRKPLRRFEDLEMTHTIKLISIDNDGIVESTIDQITRIRNDNENVCASDIAIVILERDYNEMCQYANSISYKIEDKFKWESTRGYITKSTEFNTVYISNINNIKGLEFPFVICIVPNKITKNILTRNGIYTSLTRSFLTSYFIVGKEANNDFLETYAKGLEEINKGYIYVSEPSEDEQKEIKTNINNAIKRARRSLDDLMDIVLSEFSDKDINKTMIQPMAETLYKRQKDDEKVIDSLRKICEQLI